LEKEKRTDDIRPLFPVYIRFLCFYRACAKGKKTYCRKLKELFSERDTDYRYAPDAAAYKSGKGYLPAENNYPDNIEKRIAEFYALMGNFFSKRSNTYSGDFKTLDTEGNPDYGQTKKDARADPFQPEKKSAEDKPKDISQ